MDFNKQALLNLMSYPNEISEKEVTELTETLQNYPYFQLGYALLAKAKHDKQTPDTYATLSKAAIYATDRRMLRKLFYEDLRIEGPTIIPSTTEENEQTESASEHDYSTTVDSYHPTTQIEENTIIPQEEEVIQSDEVYDELEENLRKLRESKIKFSEEEEESKKKITDEAEINDDRQEKDFTLIPDQASEENLVTQHVDPRHQQQIELIDKFINSKDSISMKNKPVVESDEEPEDLSYQSTETTENLISENLAEIYVKQGKKEKAIEIYQKLIWKFPQKKAYFAEKIESLKAE